MPQFSFETKANKRVKEILYELKFPNGCKLDSKGRVIIER